jgi:RNA polymerase sigma-70 factor, ECF subfamily
VTGAGATPGDARSDEALLAAYVAGDSGAYSVLVDRYARRVYGICYRYFRDPTDAEDAAQETFVTLLRRAETFTGAAAFSTWLYRVTTNTCNDMARKRSRRPRTVPLPDAGGDEPAAADLLANRELALELRDALSALDAEHREAVVLHDVLGLPYADIAERSGVAVGTVKSRIHRAHARLAGALRASQGAPTEPSPPARPPTSQ